MSNNKLCIPVFYACDDNFIPYTCVSIKSLIDNSSPEYDYNIHILNTGLSDNNKELINSLANSNHNIILDDVSANVEELSKRLPVRDYYSLTTYYRVLIPQLYPDYNKAIYLDADTIIKSDISKLYNITLGEAYVGACVDRVVAQTDILGDYVENVLGIKRKKYFNAGILLLNCKQYRNLNLLEEFIEFLHIYSFVVGQDQDYLNLIFKDHVFYMEPKWNAQVFGKLACSEAEVAIFHYNMAAKPWNYPECRFAEYFWTYAKKLSCYEEIKNNCNNYTDEQRNRDEISGQHLIELAVSEINNEDNYLRRTNNNLVKNPEMLKVLEKIKILEKEGRFTEDVFNDPPSIPLNPEDIEYLPKSLKKKLDQKHAYRIGKWFLDVLLLKRQIIIKDYVGLDNFKKVRKNGAVITCNHFNPFDSFAITLAFEKGRPNRGKLHKKHLYRVIKEGNYTNFPGFYGFLMRNCYTLPLSSNPKTMEKFLAAVDKVLSKGHFLLVYPEQGLWWNYRKPRPLQKGAFTFAARNNKPVLPVFITMEDSNILDNDGFYVQEYTVHFCEPIYPDPDLKKNENAKMMCSKNYQAWKEVYEKTYNKKLVYTCDEK